MSFMQITDNIRVEQGPARKRAVATKELLSDEVTAKHYKVGLKDALGKEIKLGEPMDYLDWKGEPGWYVYREELVDKQTPSGKKKVPTYVAKGFHATQEAAIQQAVALAKED